MQPLAAAKVKDLTGSEDGGMDQECHSPGTIIHTACTDILLSE